MAEWQVVKREEHDQLGEGACWSPRDNAFYWVDILAPALNRLTLVNGATTRWGAVSLMRTRLHTMEIGL